MNLPLRLQNGLYLQLHAYICCILIALYARARRASWPLLLNGTSAAPFYHAAEYPVNWVKLEDVGDILEALADVDMHAIQTSGNCIRNVTSDHFAGAVADEVEDPRITAELLRQWSTGHPEFAFLPRKFKIAVSATRQDRAVIAFHDIGIELRQNEAGEAGYRILIGGGLGRTPIIGQEITSFC